MTVHLKDNALGIPRCHFKVQIWNHILQTTPHKRLMKNLLLIGIHKVTTRNTSNIEGCPIYTELVQSCISLLDWITGSLVVKIESKLRDEQSRGESSVIIGGLSVRDLEKMQTIGVHWFHWLRKNSIVGTPELQALPLKSRKNYCRKNVLLIKLPLE